MKADIDRLMAERSIDCLLVTGATSGNPAMYYLAKEVKVTESTILVKKRGEAPTLVVNPMERDEAAKSGLAVIPQSRYEPLRLLSEEHGDALRARVRMLDAIFADLDVRGRVAIFGREDQGRALAMAQAFNDRHGAAVLVGEYSETILDAAWMTKDAAEVQRIRSVGERTVNVVARTAGFLQSHEVRDGVLVQPEGAVLTIADVKRRIRRWLGEYDLLDDPDSLIFAIGADAGVPHSRGEDGDVVQLGHTIVFDIFPRDSDGGYCYDFTRTWCLDHASPRIEQCYEDVLGTMTTIMDEMRAGMQCRAAQRRANELFGQKGYATLHSNPKTASGYVHSLGHGIGLAVHEQPSLSDYEGNIAVLRPGSVVTIEPGLYYPQEGFGIRIEDTTIVDPTTGRLEVLVPFSRDLILPMKKR